MNLRRIMWLARKELIHIRRDRVAMRAIIGLPIIQLLLVGYAATLDVDHIPTAFYDQDRSGASRALARRMEGSGHFRLVATPADAGGLRHMLDAGRVKLAVFIMRGYARGIASGRGAQVGVLLDGTDATTARIAASYLQNMLAQENQRLVGARHALPLLDARGRRAPLPPIVLLPSIRYNPALRSRDFMVPGVVGLIVLVLTMSLSTVAIVREREMGTLERLMMAPVAPAELIAGKLVPYLGVALFESGLALAVAHLWFRVPIRGSLLFLYAAVVLFAINALGLGLFVSSLARTQQQVVLTNVFVIMPSVLMSGFIAPIRNMPLVVQYLTYFIPLRYFLDIVRGVTLKGLTPAEVWPQLVALAALTAAAVIAGAAMLRRRL